MLRRWVVNPNIVTIIIQDAWSYSLRITVYGKPEYFEGMKRSLTIQRDMWGYSRFIVSYESQLTSAIDVINHSYNPKKERERFYMH